MSIQETPDTRTAWIDLYRSFAHGFLARAEVTRYAPGEWEDGKFVSASRWEDVDVLPGDQVSYGDFRSAGKSEEDDATHWIPDLLSFSDYSGSDVERSNYRVFMERFRAFVVDVYGDHGTTAVAIPLDWAGEDADEAREMLASLTDYPVIDEDDMSQLGMELENEAWDSWAAYDFKKELGKRLSDLGLSEEDEERADETLDAAESSDLREFFETLRESANEYWECETGGGMYIRIERVAAEATLRAVLEFCGMIPKPDATQETLPLDA